MIHVGSASATRKYTTFVELHSFVVRLDGDGDGAAGHGHLQRLLVVRDDDAVVPDLPALLPALAHPRAALLAVVVPLPLVIPRQAQTLIIYYIVVALGQVS